MITTKMISEIKTQTLQYVVASRGSKVFFGEETPLQNAALEFFTLELHYRLFKAWIRETIPLDENAFFDTFPYPTVHTLFMAMVDSLGKEWLLLPDSQSIPAYQTCVLKEIERIFYEH